MGFIISKKKEEVCFDRAKNAANEKFGKEEERVLDIISYMRDEELDTWEDGRTIAHFNRELIRIKTKKRLFTKNIMNHFIENYTLGQDSFQDNDKIRVMDLKSASEVLLEGLKGFGDG